jgi:hypothetical protein
MKKLFMIMLCAGSIITALSACSATQEGQGTATDSTSVTTTDTTMMDTTTRDTVVTDTAKRDSM